MHEPEHIQIEPEQRTAREIRQHYYEVAERDKLRALVEILPEMSGGTLIFCNMKVTVDRLVRRLRERDIPADAIHGDLDQRKRDRVMQQFRSGELRFLVATNVAARGLDIPDLNHVVNFDLPQNADEYVHVWGGLVARAARVAPSPSSPSGTMTASKRSRRLLATNSSAGDSNSTPRPDLGLPAPTPA